MEYSNPYKRSYKQPKGRYPHQYRTRGRQNINTPQEYMVNSNALFEFSSSNEDTGTPTFMNIDEQQRQNTPNPYIPQSAYSAKSQSQDKLNIPTPIQQTPIPKQKASNLQEQLQEIQSLINTQKVQQNLEPYFEQADQQGTSKQDYTNQIDQSIQQLMELCRNLMSKQTQQENRFSSIENNANALVGDIQNAFINTEQKIPSIQYLQQLFQQYTSYIGGEVSNLIKERQLTIQQSMNKRHAQSHKDIESNSQEIRNIMQFQKQFSTQCNNFQGMLNELQNNYVYLQKKISTQTPQQLSESKLSTKVYDLVIQRVAERLNELFQQFQNRSYQTLSTNMSSYVTKEFQRLQTDMSQSIKKQQLYEYGLLKKDIDQQRQLSQADKIQQESIQSNYQNQINLQIQQIQQQLQQLQLIPNTQPHQQINDQQVRIIDQQQSEINTLKEQVQQLITTTQQPIQSQASQVQQQNYNEHTLQQWQLNNAPVQYGASQGQLQPPQYQHEIKMDKFRGKSNAQQWIYKLEMQLQLRPDLSDHTATLIALDHLQDQAYRWAFTHSQYYATQFDQFNPLNNIYSFQAFKKLFLQKYTKPIEDFQGQLLAEKQAPNQTYDEFAKKLNAIAAQGNVQESYLKLIFFSNIKRQDVSLHLQSIRDDPKYDLIDAAREAYFMEERLSLIKAQERNRTTFSKGPFNRDKDRPRQRFRLRSRPKASNKREQKVQAIEYNNEEAKNQNNNSQAIQFMNDTLESNDEKEDSNNLDEFDYEVYDQSSSEDENTPSINMLSMSSDQKYQEQQLQNISPHESQYDKANKYRFNVDYYFNNKRTDITLNELFQNSLIYKEQLKSYVKHIDTQGTNKAINQINMPQVNLINVEAESPESLKYIYVRIGRQQTLATIDTGAHKTAISSKFFQSLRLPNAIEENKKRFRLGNGDFFTPSAMVRIPIIINDVSVNTQAILMDNVDYNILIGLDFINSIEGGILGNYFLYKHPQTQLLQSVLITHIEQKSSKGQKLIEEYQEPNQEGISMVEQQNNVTPKALSKQVFPLKTQRPWSKLKAPLTRKQKFYVKIPEPLRSKVIDADQNKLNEKYKQSYLYPKFPLKNKYQLILIDYPFKYEAKNQLSPEYDVLSQDDLKRLPIDQIADPKGCVVLQWASGITINRAIELSKHYGLKHYQVFHTWRKTNKDGTLYTSKQLKPITTAPNNEFLLMAVKGDWKHILKENRPIIMQELQAQIQPHSKKPSQVYQTIKSIFKVENINCLEVFATIDKHPYFDLYGNMVPKFFQPSLKVIPNEDTSINTIQKEPSIKDKIENITNKMLRNAKLNQVNKEKAITLISKCTQAFALSEHEVGEIQDMEFPIDLVPGAQPFAQKPFTLPEKDKRILEEQIGSWEKLKYIRKQNSEWASPAFLVPKEGGKFRVCTDYRYLNVFTIPVHGPIPNIQELFLYLVDMYWISKVDLKSSYQNLRIREQDINKTAFVCHLGIFVCLRMLFGQKNSASYFQLAIENILKPLLYKCVIVYIDDILIFSPTLEQHFKDLQAVFELLIKGNVKLHCDKSTLFLQEVEFLGHTIKDGKYYPRPKKSGVLQTMQPPQNKTQLKSFLGLIGFYRKFVQNFSIIANPLNELLKKDVTFKWSDQCQAAFEYLKERVVELPALYLPDNKKTYYLSTDFCIDGIAAVLSQKDQDNNEYPIEFASRSLNVHERKYGSYEGEILAVIWSFQKFRHLLINNQFVLYTDNKALSQVLQKQNPSLKIQRWLQILNDFSFLVIHRKGKNNGNADALSRLNPLFKEEQQQQINTLEDTSYEPIDLADIACKVCKKKSAKDMLICELCSRGYHSYCIESIPKQFPSEFYYCTECLEKITKGEVKDLILDFHVLNYVKDKQLSQECSFQEKQRILKRAKQLAYDKEQQRFMVKVNNEYKIIPTIVERKQIIQQNHDNSSHSGALRTCSLILQRYYWRNIQHWVKQHISKCALCIANKSKFNKQTEYIPTPKGSHPGQYWAIDLATNLPVTKDGFKHLLVVVDAFSKWVDLIELKSKESKEITEKIHRHIISTFGKPLAFRSDRGGEFKGMFNEFCKALSITHDCTYPNHPRGNGQAESLVKFSIELLKRTIYQRQFLLNEWVKCIPTVLYTLRFSNSIANIPPFQVVFGRKPDTISPLDLQVKQTNFTVTDQEIKEYAKQLAQSQKELFPKIKQYLEDIDENRKQKYEQAHNRSVSTFEKGQMLFRNAGPRTTKLQLSSNGPYMFVQYKGPTGAIIQDPVTSRQYEVNKYDLVGVPKLTNDPLDVQPQLEDQDPPNIYEETNPSQIKRGRPHKQNGQPIQPRRGRPKKN